MTTVPLDIMKAGHLLDFGKSMSAPLASGSPDIQPQKVGGKRLKKKEKF